MSITQTTIDPVASAGRQITAYVQAVHQASEMEQEARMLKQCLRQFLMKDCSLLLMDRIDALKEVVTFGQAQSAEGAIAQLLIAHGEVQTLPIWPHPVGETEDLKVQGQLKAIIASVMSVLETISGANRNEFGGSYFMHPQSDGHLMVSRLMAEADPEYMALEDLQQAA